jgi:hypothetical protein
MHFGFILFFILVVTNNAQSPSFPDCKSGPLSTFPICNQSLPTRQRAADLVSRLTTAEKITRLGTSSAGVDRLGLPKFMSGGGVDLTYVRDSNECGSLIWMGYARQSGGLALANVILGQYNPGGRLPITYYPALYVDAVSMFDIQMRPSPTNPGRTYKFYTGQPVFEFGYGLSYTTFSYTWYNDSINSIVSIYSLIKNKSNEHKVLLHLYRVNVTNTGSVLGDDVVLAYVTPPQQSLNDPSPPIKR